ncbi:MAG: acetoacetate--CoA ligase [Deltaproteobacteria bacterium]|nr:acetoacetate--CoA ligase [Deltaproteobacteria bacterium]MBW2152822.1 acetoacetate--CoA ligase [Deltaproteobacteria bacterium]
MAELLWEPSEERIKNSNMYRFMNFVNDRCGTHYSDYDALYHWSIENIPDFWAALWDFVEVKASSPYECVVDDLSKMPGAQWFCGAKLNFAENLLRFRDDSPAIIFRGEGGESTRITYRQLYQEVARTAKSLSDIGVRPQDRVVGFMPNIPQTIVAMLAAASMGAIWSSCSPDFGINGVLDRFGQIKPKVLFTADGYAFNGKQFDSLQRISHILKDIPTVEKVVVVPYINENPDIRAIPNSVFYEEFKSVESNPDIRFSQLPFSHPLYIMYSSGTTGLPKCMVQSAGGILLHHLKELILHTDLKKEDTIFYFTTCGWMMWNWLVSSLAVGATVVLYDGHPFYPHAGALWEMAQEERISIFGTSAGYIAALQKFNERPGEKYDLSALKAVLSTGSPLSIEGFKFIYDAVKRDIQLASISGGSDINGCFALGNPMGPVYAGELQCRGLGMKVEAFDENGKPVRNQQAELVCTAAFPSMPIYFWNDPSGEKYHSAYFDVYPNVWRHGDFIEITERGGVIMYGRSDATLNPGGVRIGTAEIYRIIDQFEEIEDSVVVGQDWKNDVRVILFLKMADGFSLSDDLKNKIKQAIRTKASPRHVPKKIICIPDIPYTLNMKKVELAVKKVIHGQPVNNKDALRNPEVLDFYAGIKELEED